jgi:hypothetical protein
MIRKTIYQLVVDGSRLDGNMWSCASVLLSIGSRLKPMRRSMSLTVSV